MSGVEITGLTVIAHDGPMVQPLDAAIEPGRTLALIGESGSGKTLTAKALIGLLPRGFRAEGSVRIGERTLRGLLLAATTYRLLEGAMPAYGFPRLYLLRHSGEVATLAQQLTRRTSTILASQAYLGGLLHDIGKAILGTIAADREVDVAAGDLRGVEDERALFGTDHARVGAWIARRW